jgi:general secretion pathway protein C
MITNHNRNIARAVMLVATLFFGWRMASLLWLLAGQDRADLAKPTLAPVTSNVAAVDGSRLATFSIFKVDTTVSAGDAANAPDTVLQLKLDGVFASNNPQQSSAIISEQGQGIGKLYQVGQQVSGGATLSAVYVDRVLLQRNGVDEVLRFVKTNLLGGDTPVVAPVAADKRGLQARDMLSQAVSRLNTEPDAYLSEMGLVAKKGQGYEITDNAPANLRRSLGLKAGDKILRLNGQPLGNPQLDKDLLQQVQQTGHARIDIQRGSQTLTIEQNF